MTWTLFRWLEAKDQVLSEYGKMKVMREQQLKVVLGKNLHPSARNQLRRAGGYLPTVVVV